MRRGWVKKHLRKQNLKDLMAMFIGGVQKESSVTHRFLALTAGHMGDHLHRTTDPLWKTCWTKNQEAWVPALALPWIQSHISYNLIIQGQRNLKGWVQSLRGYLNSFARNLPGSLLNLCLNTSNMDNLSPNAAQKTYLDTKPKSAPYCVSTFGGKKYSILGVKT